MKMKNICGVNNKSGSSLFSTGAAGRAQSSPSCCVERGLDTVASHLGAPNSPQLSVTPLFLNTEHPIWGPYFLKEPSERVVDNVHFKAGGRRRASWTLSSPTEVGGTQGQPQATGWLTVTERETRVSPVSLGAARTEKDALTSGTTARPYPPSLDRLLLGVTKHCPEVLGLTAS